MLITEKIQKIKKNIFFQRFEATNLITLKQLFFEKIKKKRFEANFSQI